MVVNRESTSSACHNKINIEAIYSNITGLTCMNIVMTPAVYGHY